MRTVLVYVLAMAALAAGAVFGFPEALGLRKPDAAEVHANGVPKAPPVIVAPVTRRPFIDTLQALGTVFANESIEVTSNTADHVTALHFDDGDQVEAGQLLVELHAEEERAGLAEAIAIRDERLSNAQRVQGLFDGNMTSQRELDAARSALAAAEARVVSLQAAIEDREIRAPFKGVLGLRKVSVGAFVQPSMLITTLDDLSVVKVEFTIPETWLGVVSAGMTVDAHSDAYPDKVFTGIVRTLDTRLDPRTRSATVLAKLDNPGHLLRPGMLLKIGVSRGEEPVLQVPEEALIPRGEQQFVVKVDDGFVAREVEVEVGRRAVGAVEILGGLEEGDRVVVEGIMRVRVGTPVEVVGTREIDA